MIPRTNFVIRSVCHRHYEGVFVFQLQKKRQHKKKCSVVSVSVLTVTHSNYSIYEIMAKFVCLNDQTLTKVSLRA